MMDQPTKVIRVLARVALMTLLVCGGSTRAFAQAIDFPVEIPFNFSTPGARANAMGRTFIGTADDSSASVTNPAGLVRLLRPQLYVEFKTTDHDIDRLAAVDSLFTREPDTFGERTSSISFFSISAPLGGRFAVAFTRNEFLQFKEHYHLAPREIPGGAFGTFFGVDGVNEFTGVSYSGSIAVTVNPRIRLGLTVSHDRLSALSRTTRFDFDFGPPIRERDIITTESEIDDDATGFSTVIGVLFLPSETFSIGVQYAKAPSFEMSQNFSFNPGFDVVNLDLVSFTDFPQPVTINVPDRFGVGVSFRPNPRLLAAVDVVRIGYSSLAENFTATFFNLDLSEENFDIDDVTELHAGAEFLAVPGDRRLFLRAGVFSNPDHSMRFIPTGTDARLNATVGSLFNLLPRETDVVGSFGAGVAIGLRFQADFAYVFGREFVASAAVRF